MIENGVYRRILAAPKYAPLCTLQRDIYCDIRVRNADWSRDFERISVTAGINVGHISGNTKEELNCMIGDWDESQ